MRRPTIRRTKRLSRELERVFMPKSPGKTVGPILNESRYLNLPTTTDSELEEIAKFSARWDKAQRVLEVLAPFDVKSHHFTHFDEELWALVEMRCGMKLSNVTRVVVATLMRERERTQP